MRESIRYVFKRKKEADIIADVYEYIERLEKQLDLLETKMGECPEPFMEEKKPTRTRGGKKHICGKVGKYKGECDECNSLR